MDNNLQCFDEIFDGVLKLEIDGKVVIPTSEIAKVYGQETSVINRSFLRHQVKFIKGIDYYAFTREDISTLFPKYVYDIKFLFPSNNQKVVYLFTYRGFFNFIKTINSKYSWAMFTKIKAMVFESISMTKKIKELNVTNELFIFDTMGIKDDYKTFHKENPNGNFRDTLSDERLSTLKSLEVFITSCVDMVSQYKEISDAITNMFSKDKLLGNCIKE